MIDHDENVYLYECLYEVPNIFSELVNVCTYRVCTVDMYGMYTKIRVYTFLFETGEHRQYFLGVALL